MFCMSLTIKFENLFTVLFYTCIWLTSLFDGQTEPHTSIIDKFSMLMLVLVKIHPDITSTVTELQTTLTKNINRSMMDDQIVEQTY